MGGSNVFLLRNLKVPMVPYLEIGGSNVFLKVLTVASFEMGGSIVFLFRN